MSKELYLGEIIKRDGVMIQKGKNNLIVAPAGSGKTHYIFNELLDKTKRNIYLCDTSNLMESIVRDEDYFDNTIALKEDLNAGKEGFELDKYNCTVMTYAKFFYEMNKLEYKDVDMIICDEIHNLFKYMDRFKENNNYKNVIEHLDFRALKGTRIVSFTATPERIQKVIRKQDFFDIDKKFKLWNVIDFSEDKEIKKLKNDFQFVFNNYRNLNHYLKAFNGFNWGLKAIIYTNRITECNDMINICKTVGLNAIAIWSLNNKDNKMNEEQLKARKSILETGLIPEEYNVLIINASYETGINIKDENIQIMVVNDTDNDTIIQARSRIRHNIKALILKSANCIDDLRITVPSEFLDRPLTTKDKRDLCKIVNVYGEKKSVLKWTSIRPIILNSGYEIVDHRITAKNIRVSTITDTDINKRILIDSSK